METDLSFRASNSKSLPSAFWEIRDILTDFESFFSDGSITNDIPIPVNLEWCAPKIRVLVDILLAHHSPTFQGIVFVEQRQVAAVLAKILPAIPQLKGAIRSAFIVGQGIGLEGTSKTTSSNQGDAVKQFSKGDINLRSYSLFCFCMWCSFGIKVIATSAAEEGLDFPVWNTTSVLSTYTQELCSRRHATSSSALIPFYTWSDMFNPVVVQGIRARRLLL